MRDFVYKVVFITKDFQYKASTKFVGIWNDRKYDVRYESKYENVITHDVLVHDSGCVNFNTVDDVKRIVDNYLSPRNEDKYKCEKFKYI